MSDTNGTTTLATYDTMPAFVITQDEYGKRYSALQNFIQSSMILNVDYGVIPGTGKKPTLLKPGAEKLCAMYGYSIHVEVTDKNLDWENDFILYEVKVTLRSKDTGQPVAEGVGCCNSRERKYRNVDVADAANTLLKMAKKRALLDATLSATRSSGLLTQDLDELDLNGDEPKAKPRPASNGRPAAAGDVPPCPKCKGGMWDNRASKRSPNAPDFKCKDKACDGAKWEAPRASNGNTPSPRNSAPPVNAVEGEYWPSDDNAPPEQPALSEVFAQDAANQQANGYGSGR